MQSLVTLLSSSFAAVQPAASGHIGVATDPGMQEPSNSAWQCVTLEELLANLLLSLAPDLDALRTATGKGEGLDLSNTLQAPASPSSRGKVLLDLLYVVCSLRIGQLGTQGPSNLGWQCTTCLTR